MTKRLVLLLGVALSAAHLAAADVLQTSNARYEGRVLRVTRDSVIIRTADAELAVPLAQIIREDIPAPAEFKDGVAAQRNADHDEAIAKLRPLAEQYAGLRSPWIVEAMMRLGDAYLAAGDFAKAKKTYTDYQSLYAKTPEAVSLMEIKFAHLEAGQKKYAEAVARAKPAMELLLKKPYLNPQEELLLSEAFLMVGDCQVADGKKLPALDSYLSVVALYDIDPGRTLEALYKAGKLFEEAGNWKRARDCYQDLLANSPTVSFAADAKKRLDAIVQAHPE